ncbi:TonB-dependent receptor [Pelobium manganitolerans]|uniref:TonB-dependent receptor n=1 Tax=Pelobium manganitolerans TaxID=1842495 RepID=UPI003FA3AC29
MKKFFTLLFASAMLPGLLWAQVTLQGKITDATTKQALSGAAVRLDDGQISLADADGIYKINNVKTGTHQISVSFVGYHGKKLTISLSNSQTFNIALEPSSLLADEVVVNATRASENSATTFKNVSKADIAKNNFGQDLPYLLDQTPSVVSFSDGGAGVGYTGLRIRGSDAARINVTINGIPYNDSESQGSFWVNLPDFATSVDNIQIQRGVGTSTNGAGAFGGSLNIQTGKLADAPYVELNNSGGSYQTLKNSLNIGTGLINGKFAFDGRLSRIVSDGYIDRASSDLKSFFASGAYYGNNSLLRLNVFSGTEKTYQAWNGVPEDKLKTDRRFNEFTYDNQTDNYQQDHYQLIYSKSFSDKISANAALHYTKGRGYYEEFKDKQGFAKYGLDTLFIGTDTIAKTDLIRRRWLSNKFYGATYAVRYQPDNKTDFTLGGAYNEYDGDHFGEIIWARYASQSGIRDKYYFDSAFKTDFNIYAKGSYRLNNISLFADMQYRHIFYQFSGYDRNLNNVAQDDELNFFNPKLGFTYFINPESNFYASYAVAHREPNRKDYTESSTNTRPKPERLDDIEIGYRIKKSWLSAGANIYLMNYKDQLVLTGQINDVGGYIRSNVKDSYRNGIELDATFGISPKLSWALTSTFSQNKVKNFVEFIDQYSGPDYDFVGQQKNEYTKTDIAFSPNYVGSSTIAYRPIKAFEVALLSKYVSKQYLDNTSNDNRKLDAFFVNNLRLNYNFALKGVKAIELGLLVNNIFNELYESNGYTFSSIYDGSISTSNYYFPQAETNFLVSLNLKF